MVRATNWLGDAFMSLPSIRTLRQVFPHAQVVLVAHPWVADLYARESSIDRIILYPAGKGLRAKREFAARLREERFDAAILLQNAFDAALIAWLAGIPERIGYNRDARGLLLTRAIPVPEPGDIPRHQRFYYLELLRRASLIERFPPRLRRTSRRARHFDAGHRHQPRSRLRQRETLVPRALRRGRPVIPIGFPPALRVRIRTRALPVRGGPDPQLPQLRRPDHAPRIHRSHRGLPPLPDH